MPPDSKLSSDAFAPRASLFYAAYCFVIGIQMPFFPVWLEAKGLDAREVGFILALPAFIRVFAVPVVAPYADRANALREVLVICAVASVLAYAGLGFAQSAFAILIAVALWAIPNTPAMALLDAYTLKGLKARGGAYGAVRLWGSASFIAANLAAGLLLDIIAARDLIWVIVAASLATAVAAFGLKPLHPAAPVDEPPAPRRALWRRPAFLLVIAAASFIQASHATYYGFSTIGWSAAGFGGLTIGGLWALGVLAEIVLFAYSGRLPFWLNPAWLVILGGIGAVIRWTAMAFDPPAASLPLLQGLHAFSFGATHLGAVGFVARIAPERASATAQGYSSVVLGLAMGLAMAMAGLLYQSFGNLSYAAMALAAAIGTAMAFALPYFWNAETRAL